MPDKQWRGPKIDPADRELERQQCEIQRLREKLECAELDIITEGRRPKNCVADWVRTLEGAQRELMQRTKDFS